MKNQKQKERVLVILGSSREDSNTLRAVQNLIPFSEYETLDLSQKNIAHYSYPPEAMADDDFDSIAQSLCQYDVFVFATPIYWYAMSGRLKVFIDRLAALTDRYKSIGKALKGKKTYAIASGIQPLLPEGFEIPFKLSSEYFDMEFQQMLYQQEPYFKVG